ncbi:MAG: Ldh family oxidoreductase [Hyphomicrobiaceae bacterium]
MTDTVALSLDEAFELAYATLTVNGCDDDNATAVANTIRAAECDGSTSHGLFRLPGYIASLRSGKVNGKARPTVSSPRPGVVIVDNDNGFSPLGISVGREPLISATRRQGIAFMALTRTFHFAALWHEIEPLCDAGLSAFACTVATPMVAPAGGDTALFGTNPVAFGWPRKDAPPMVFDMATAAMARGEIMLAARDGHEVPEGAGLDASRQPTTDPDAILNGGVQLPFGGYKGSAIALMVELWAAALIGERFSFEAGEADNGDGGPARSGEFIVAIDPAAAAGDAWVKHAEGLFARMLEMDGLRLPGDRRYTNRQRSPQEGLAVPAPLFATINELKDGGGASTA